MLKMFETNQPDSPKSRFEVRGNGIHFISLGCPRNLVDSEVMLGLLLERGYQPEEDPTNADVVVINTCGFLKESRKESMDTVESVLKNRKKGARVIVAGCMVQSHSDEIKSKLPEVDYFLGSGDVEGIIKAVETDASGSMVTQAKSYLEAGEVPRQLSTPGHYAYVKIAEGCRKRCSYCIIPDIKGPLKSKSVEQILKEFRTLISRGVQEIILIAQDLGDWGKDLGYKKSSGLVHLLKELLKEEGDFWIRLLYLYPDEITDELIEVMQSDERVCRYLDMPIQHINDRVLKSMRRATNQNQIIHSINQLRTKLPEVVIRTSLIVGFPGETDEEFEELCQFVEESELDNVGIFKYSREPGSHADTLEGHIEEEVKQQRFDRLMSIQKEVVESINEGYLDDQLEVIIEGYHPDSDLLMRGRHRGQSPEIDGQVIINDGLELVDAFKKRYLVEITGSAGYDLLGRVVQID